MVLAAREDSARNEPGHDQQQDDGDPGDDHRARTNRSAREEAVAAGSLTSVGVALLTRFDGRVGVAQPVRADPPCPARRLRDVDIGEPVVGIRRLRKVAIGDRSNVQRTAGAA